VKIAVQQFAIALRGGEFAEQRARALQHLTGNDRLATFSTTGDPLRHPKATRLDGVSSTGPSRVRFHLSANDRRLSCSIAEPRGVAMAARHHGE